MIKTYVLDTNVLLDDPSAVTSFDDNNVIIPLVVIEEMDRFKDKPGDLGANAREFSRFLSKFIQDGCDLREGTPTKGGGTIKVVTMSDLSDYQANLEDLPELNDYHGGDNKILQVLIGLTNKAKEEGQDLPVLVTRDIQLRVKCSVLNLLSEDRRKGGVSSSIAKLYTGVRVVPVTSEIVQSINEDRDTPISLSSIMPFGDYETLSPNEYVVLEAPDKTVLKSCVYRHDATERFIHTIKTPSVYKLQPRNMEQRIAIDMLMDPKIKLCSIIGRAGSGKAQPLYSKLLTPSGWTTMGEIKVGDKLVGQDGKPTEVLGVYPQGKKDVYEITFSDGSTTRCCKEHLWETKTSKERDYGHGFKVRSLEEIMNTIHYGTHKKRNHMIPTVEPISFVEKPVPLDPYLLGVLLGDGGMASSSVTLSSADSEIIDLVSEKLKDVGAKIRKKKSSKYDYVISKIVNGNDKNKVVEALSLLGLMGKKSEHKEIPDCYKFNTVETRIKLLQGLLDTDGFVSKNGMSTVFYSASENLSKGVQEIVQSLGGKAVIRGKQTYYTHNKIKKAGLPSFAVHISLPEHIVPVTISRKLSRFVPRSKYQPSRYIESVKFVGTEETQCIMVDNKRHLYITDDYIVTHNTLVSLAAGLEQVIGQKKYKTLFVCRPIQPVGRDIGFLPGDKAEKLEPWVAPIKDNLKYLLSNSNSNDKKSKADMETTFEWFVEKGIIEVEAMTYIRGRSISNAYMIIDEAQNLSAHELKTIITRVGEGTKIVLTGDIEQIDNLYVDSISNGLTVAIEKFRGSDLTAHISLVKGERSALATLAADCLD